MSAKRVLHLSPSVHKGCSLVHVYLYFSITFFSRYIMLGSIDTHTLTLTYTHSLKKLQLLKASVLLLFELVIILLSFSVSLMIYCVFYYQHNFCLLIIAFILSHSVARSSMMTLLSIFYFMVILFVSSRPYNCVGY
jgi:hypothetical protein